ncbi:hypothetical protein [Pseudomonas triticifolii]|nr:hypothetical protein [Pseudomonas triticifolii]
MKPVLMIEDYEALMTIMRERLAALLRCCVAALLRFKAWLDDLWP